MSAPKVEVLKIHFDVPEEDSKFHGVVREEGSKVGWLRFSKGGDGPGRYFVDVPFSETSFVKLIDDMSPVPGQHFMTVTMRLPVSLEGPGTLCDENGQPLKDPSRFN